LKRNRGNASGVNVLLWLHKISLEPKHNHTADAYEQ